MCSIDRDKYKTNAYTNVICVQAQVPNGSFLNEFINRIQFEVDDRFVETSNLSPTGIQELKFRLWSNGPNRHWLTPYRVTLRSGESILFEKVLRVATRNMLNDPNYQKGPASKMLQIRVDAKYINQPLVLSIHVAEQRKYIPALFPEELDLIRELLESGVQENFPFNEYFEF